MRERADPLCPVCGSVALPVQEHGPFSLVDRTLAIDDEFYRCIGCGEEFYSEEQLAAAERKLHAAAHAQLGVLLPEEIRALREQLGLSAEQFEQLVGVEPYTVYRWERGKLLASAAENALLRLLQARPELAGLLAQWHGVVLTGPDPRASA